MDFLGKHWAPFPRKFPSPFPVNTAAFIEQKPSWVRSSFRTCNFSLILRGRGDYLRNGKTWEVRAPCVITQWPEEFLEYGPLPGETWDELYITYAAETMPKFQRCRLVDLECPVWPIADPAAVHAQIAELDLLAHFSHPEAAVDRVDRVCERLLLETRIAPQSTVEGEPAIETVLAAVRRNLGTAIDFDAAAAQAGMSASTFRRRWAAVSKIPPARYLYQLRMREACRLLVETRQPIFQIAHAVGFQDELYFSRRFHKELKMAPRDYRKNFQLRRPEA